MIPVYLRYRVFFGPTRVFLPSWAMLSAVFKNISKPSSPWEAMNGLHCLSVDFHLTLVLSTSKSRKVKPAAENWFPE